MRIQNGPKVGLISLDEAKSSSYCSEETPLSHARRTGASPSGGHSEVYITDFSGSLGKQAVKIVDSERKLKSEIASRVIAAHFCKGLVESEKLIVTDAHGWDEESKHVLSTSYLDDCSEASLNNYNDHLTDEEKAQIIFFLSCSGLSHFANDGLVFNEDSSKFGVFDLEELSWGANLSLSASSEQVIEFISLFAQDKGTVVGELEKLSETWRSSLGEGDDLHLDLDQVGVENTAIDLLFNDIRSCIGSAGSERWREYMD